jgi:hypothetical protein
MLLLICPLNLNKSVRDFLFLHLCSYTIEKIDCHSLFYCCYLMHIEVIVRKINTIAPCVELMDAHGVFISIITDVEGG